MKSFLLAAFCLFTMASCGKAQGDPVYQNECNPAIVSGRECIVCERGGVSCNWN